LRFAIDACAAPAGKRLCYAPSLCCYAVSPVTITVIPVLYRALPRLL